MSDVLLSKAVSCVYSYIMDNIKNIDSELLHVSVSKMIYPYTIDYKNIEFVHLSYDRTQKILAKINEKGKNRKNNGVYYTPNDVVEFIFDTSVKCSSSNKLDNDILQTKINLNDNIVLEKTVFDPTCGVGEFLLSVLEKKVNSYLSHHECFSEEILCKTVGTIYGNDIDNISVIITKLRIYLYLVNKFGIRFCSNIDQILNKNFYSIDYITCNDSIHKKFDFIIGNPPYVEDNKSGSVYSDRYGNIYANILINASKHLDIGGVLGFIIPLSYVSTPRMKKLREILFKVLPKQYIFNYADRPDCLFDSVHQKLSIIIGKKTQNDDVSIYTSNYRYWYKEERFKLFSVTEIIKNNFASIEGIPKLGNHFDTTIYSKIINSNDNINIYDISRTGDHVVYLNRRETFWMKAFREERNDTEYKIFRFDSSLEADYCYCLVNSSLFWWYWIAVSDCWHVSKNLNGFKAPWTNIPEKVSELANNLINKLENTKVFVGTKQVDYEYKHKLCYQEILQIDDFINTAFGLTKAEGEYIKYFAYKYRFSEGAETINTVDLFAGCGGLSLGFSEAGFRIRKAVEFDPEIAKTYIMNNPSTEVLVEDIKKIDNSDILKLCNADVIIGGPPCQGFSMAGSRIRHGFIDDPRNYLFKHYFNIVRAIRPKVFLLENVKGIATMQNGAIFNEIINIFQDPNELEGNTYHMFTRIVNTADFGIPQKRERMIIIGTLNNVDMDLLWEETCNDIIRKYPDFFNRVCIGDAISNLYDTTETGCIENPKPITNYQKYLYRNTSFIFNHTQSKHSQVAINRMARIKNGENFRVLDENINSVHSGAYGRLSWDELAPTITTRFDTPAGGRFIHPDHNRTISPREAARIQSFPDDFVFYGSKRSISRQIGNAVPPKLAFFLACLTKNILRVV